MRPSEELIVEHGKVQEMLTILTKISQKARTEGRINTAHLHKAVGYLQMFVDRCHHGKEERCYFPAVAAAGDAESNELIRALLEEHTEGREHVAAIKNKLTDYQEGDHGAFDELLANIDLYAILIDEHIKKENGVLFPRGDGLLNDGQAKELMTEYAEVDLEELGQAGGEEMQRVLEELRREYLP